MKNNFKNHWLEVNEEKIKTIINEVDQNITLIKIIDGNKLQNEEVAVKLLRDLFNSPKAINWDQIIDWMTDLDLYIQWNYNSTEYEEIILVIKHYINSFKDNKEDKDIFEDIFRSDHGGILRFWESEVEKFVVGGKRKKFNIYVID